MSRALVGALAFFVALGCGEEEVATHENLSTVSVARVESIDLNQEIRASGDLRARFHTTIAAEVEGRITGIAIEEGGAVEKGAVVLEIDPARRNLDVGAARARLAQSRANHVKEEHQTERIRKLRSQSVASEQQLEEAETALLLAESSVEADRAALGVAQRALADASVSAPFAGLVAMRAVQLGEFVQPGTALFELVSLDLLEVVFSLAELDMQLVEKGQRVEIEVAAFRDRTFQGVVTFVSPTVDPATRTLRIKAEVANAEGELRPGLFARVSLGLNRREGVLMLPVEAVMRRAAGAFVFRLVAGDRVERIAVETGVQDGERVEVRGPLAAGDPIVHRGHAGLVDGAVVSVRGGSGQPAVAAQGVGVGEGS
ncbi:MAG: efflux RND transporter periplasmic adaptor subunit [Deltaproteobacteria bacterium]|nr:efflux RND transporter periplasmic adaptor subunit [Deltaproteobacteria bacterium]MBW2359520.1 efflux RND transporter periplasmic adaptor subunit [Deltaproteobacteria bacterium]